MPAQVPMSLARMLQGVVLAVAAASAGWLWWFWPRAPWLAVAGAAAIALGHTVVLAAEFACLPRVQRADPAPMPTVHQLARAWSAECVAAFRVFCWRQPFRPNAVPDSPTAPAPEGTASLRGVVLIHGFVCNRGLWTPWLRVFRAQGRPFAAVNLLPVFGSIDDCTLTVDEAVTRITRATGMPPVLVCHSMGGLVARAWLRAYAADSRVAHVITLGTPHHGTWLGRFSLSTNGRQMRIGSPWLTQLAAQEGRARRAKFTCWYSNCDNIVFPASTATLPDADNRHLAGRAHMQLAFDGEVLRGALAKIASV